MSDNDTINIIDMLGILSDEEGFRVYRKFSKIMATFMVIAGATLGVIVQGVFGFFIGAVLGLVAYLGVFLYQARKLSEVLNELKEQRKHALARKIRFLMQENNITSVMFLTHKVWNRSSDIRYKVIDLMEKISVYDMSMNLMQNGFCKIRRHYNAFHAT